MNKIYINKNNAKENQIEGEDQLSLEHSFFPQKIFDETEVDRKLEEQIIKDFHGRISIFQDLL